MKRWSQEEVQALWDLYKKECKVNHMDPAAKTVKKYEKISGRTCEGVYRKLMAERKRKGSKHRDKVIRSSFFWGEDEDAELMNIYKKHLGSEPTMRKALSKTVKEFGDSWQNKDRSRNAILSRIRALSRGTPDKPLYPSYNRTDRFDYEPRGRHNVAIGERIMSEMEALGCL